MASKRYAADHIFRNVSRALTFIAGPGQCPRQRLIGRVRLPAWLLFCADSVTALYWMIHLMIHSCNSANR